MKHATISSYPIIQTVIQLTLDRLYPGFGYEMFRDMLEAYEVDPDFWGTNYQNERHAIQAFHLYREILKLDNWVV